MFDGHTEANYAKLARIASRAEEMLGDEIKTRLIVSKGEKPENLDWDGEILLDSEHTLHARYGAGTPSLCFVRPDGYIGFRCQPAREEPLLDYLGSLFVLQECAKTTAALSNSR